MIGKTNAEGRKVETISKIFFEGSVFLREAVLTSEKRERSRHLYEVNFFHAGKIYTMKSANEFEAGIFNTNRRRQKAGTLYPEHRVEDKLVYFKTCLLEIKTRNKI